MKKINKFIHQMTAPLAATLFVLLFAGACSQSTDGVGTLKVVLHDNPGNFDEVVVEVLRVEVNNEQDEETGWVVINEPGESYNLLDLVNGAHVVLGETELEAGIYRQIRLILGDGNYVVIDGEPYDMQTPSGQQTGIKLNIDAEIREGITYTLAIDFDAHRSVVKQGQTPVGAPFLLTPVIRAYAQAETGMISGVVEPWDATNLTVSTVENVGDNPVSTTVEENTGAFKLLGLPEGTYSIIVESDDFDAVTVTDIEVVAGEDTDAGTISLVDED